LVNRGFGVYWTQGRIFPEIPDLEVGLHDMGSLDSATFGFSIDLEKKI